MHDPLGNLSAIESYSSTKLIRTYYSKSVGKAKLAASAEHCVHSDHRVTFGQLEAMLPLKRIRRYHPTSIRKSRGFVVVQVFIVSLPARTYHSLVRYGQLVPGFAVIPVAGASKLLPALPRVARCANRLNFE